MNLSFLLSLIVLFQLSFSQEALAAKNKCSNLITNSSERVRGVLTVTQTIHKLENIGYSPNTAQKIVSAYPALAIEIIESGEKPMILFRGFKLSHPGKLVTSIKSNPSKFHQIFFSRDLSTAVKFSQKQMPGVSTGPVNFAVVLEFEIPSSLISTDPVNNFPTINRDTIRSDIDDLVPFISRRANMDLSSGRPQYPNLK